VQCACAVLYSHLWLVCLPHFSTLSHKRHYCRKRLLNVKCVFWFSLQGLSETFLIPRRIQRDNKCTKVLTQSTRYPCQILIKLKFRFSKNFQIQNFMKIRPVEAELYHEDRQTDEHRGMTKLTVAFRNFTNALKSWTAEFCATELIWSTSKFQTCNFYAVVAYKNSQWNSNLQKISPRMNRDIPLDIERGTAILRRSLQSVFSSSADGGGWTTSQLGQTSPPGRVPPFHSCLFRLIVITLSNRFNTT
jgi:hypothetical protein